MMIELLCFSSKKLYCLNIVSITLFGYAEIPDISQLFRKHVGVNPMQSEMYIDPLTWKGLCAPNSLCSLENPRHYKEMDPGMAALGSLITDGRCKDGRQEVWTDG